jgi:4-amino-4-deoxy-L-arabinose transferase-like glycosyltransferase
MDKKKFKKNSKISKFFGKNWQLLVVIFLAITFFFIASSYNFLFQTPDYVKWGSPDENANYIFSKIYAETGNLTITEKYNLYTGGLIHPRSFKSDGLSLKPISFLGLILVYGNLAKVFGIGILPYLTPFFAALGLIFFYLFIKRVFNKKIAFFSALFLFSFPAYVYYSARSMFHNVLFIFFVIMFFYFLTFISAKKKKRIKKEKKFRKEKLVEDKKKFIGEEKGKIIEVAESSKIKFLNTKFSKKIYFSWLASFLSGLFFGLALMTRTSEILWLFPVLFLSWLFYIKEVSFTKIILFLSGTFLGLLPMFYYNQLLFGAIWQGGYSEMNRSLLEIGQAGAGLVKPGNKPINFLNNFWQVLIDNIFYFGFKPWQSIKVFYFYFASMFYWLFWPMAFGFLSFLCNIHKWSKKYWLYILAWLGLAVFLMFYYGSWKFTDNPNPNSFTIGNSYTRYWLPIYLGAIPLASVFINKLVLTFFKGKKNIVLLLRNISFCLIFIAIFFVSFYFLIFGSEEGLYFTYKKSQKARINVEKVIEKTEYNSVIITQYHDKLLFPERKVINGLLTDKNMNYYYSEIANYLPLYYFNFNFPEKDVKYLNEKKLLEVGLNIEKITEINNDFSLYKLYNVKNLGKALKE